jgi:hypothetical protein
MRQEWRLCEGLLRETHRVCENADAELVLLVIPQQHAVSPRWVRFLESLGCEVTEELTCLHTLNDWIGDFAARERIACLETLGDIRAAAATGQRPYFETDDHMTPLPFRFVPVLHASRARGKTPSRRATRSAV